MWKTGGRTKGCVKDRRPYEGPKGPRRTGVREEDWST